LVYKPLKGQMHS